MKSDAGLLISNCLDVKLIGNYFTNFGTLSGNALGLTAPFMTFSANAWTLTARFNFFENNAGGMFIMTGVLTDASDHALNGRTFEAPTASGSAINFNQFRDGANTNTNAYDIAMVALDKHSTHYGPIDATTAFNNNPLSSVSIDANNNLFLASKTVSDQVTTTTTWAGAGASTECLDPTAVWDSVLSQCHQDHAGCANG